MKKGDLFHNGYDSDDEIFCLGIILEDVEEQQSINVYWIKHYRKDFEKTIRTCYSWACQVIS